MKVTVVKKYKAKAAVNELLLFSVVLFSFSESRLNSSC